ncbi:protein MpCYP823A2 [Marchantia polymorpha subsp. ruderalis]|uniref:Cytochrome P450 n=2 Tax=Marchantia polymorpha TaxID=3197 RepID=A0A176W0G0_MARPO|nr:hypothetical protein AXG93_3817s1010 [Marchantia polymorpha subsp. ruderalis]PTQ32861.1 hypothetical protein MARPO_0094s0036 [Marchantia polymorpha]PTQ32862.1 hypothetical protein MARPO_0094s0036 [Marchantia polymorpha]BBN02736.1 hypothetical protein Mp_2g17680 [Marchantia polymorpha subsp. ruderalis]|eukprot:PTQ32861.1 hypothetical protein MARPO_0094s0036 [Marchantia polymorpha]
MASMVSSIDFQDLWQRAPALAMDLVKDPEFWIALAVITVAYLIVLPYVKLMGKKLPPGPPVWPVLGSLPYLGGELHEVLWSLSKKYGDVMRVGLGQYNLIVISSAEASEECMRLRDTEFHHRSARTIQRSAAKYVGHDGQDIVFSDYNDHLRMLRKVCTTELFTVARMNKSAQLRGLELRRLLRTVQSFHEKGEPMEVRDHFHSLTMNVMCLMMFGKRYYGADLPVTQELQNFQRLIRDTFDNAGRLNLSDLVWFLRPFDLQGINKTLGDIRIRSEKLYGMIIQEHRERRVKAEAAGSFATDDKDAMDFVDVLITPTDERSHISDKAITGLLHDMVLAGTDTSATTLEWALLECVRNPDMQKKLHEELDRVIGRDRPVEESDIQNLPYLNAFIKEVFRMRTTGPITLPRLNEKPSTLGGYYIPANSTVFVNIFAIAHDPRYWDKPMEFNPDRFLNSNIGLLGNDYQLTPFGAGRRKCVGMALGTVMVFRSLATLMHAYEWSLPEGTTPETLDTSAKYLLVLRNAVPLRVNAKPRLPSRIYFDQ